MDGMTSVYNIAAGAHQLWRLHWLIPGGNERATRAANIGDGLRCRAGDNPAASGRDLLESNRL